MTQSGIERGERGASSGRGGMSWLWVALGIMLILLLAWWFWPYGTGVTERADEARISESGQPGADESVTSSDRIVAIPASPGIATRDVDSADAADADRVPAPSAGAAADSARAAER